MSYKIYVDSDNYYRVCCGEFEDFNEAVTQVKKMIVDLFESAKENDFMDCWSEFVEEFPEKIAEIIRSFETNGSATADFSDEGDTENCHYVVDGHTFRTYECENGTYFPSYALQTNMLNMSDDGTEYRFRLWSSMAGECEGLRISLEEVY